MNRQWCNSLTIALALCGAQCGRSSDPTFYALSPLPGRSWTSPLKRVKLLRVGLAGYLDRATIVRGIEGNRLELAPGEHWAEPLATMLTRTLAQDMAARLSNVGVLCEGAGIDSDADAVVDVSFERLDVTGRQLVLLAVVTVQHQGSPPRSPERVQLTQIIDTGSVSALIDADNQLIGKLADHIVQVLIREG